MAVWCAVSVLLFAAAAAAACNPFSDENLLRDAAERIQHDIVVEVPGMSPCMYYASTHAATDEPMVWIAVKWDYTQTEYTVQSNVIGLSPVQFTIYDTGVEDAVANVVRGLRPPLFVQQPLHNLGIDQTLITAAAVCIEKNIVIHVPNAESCYSKTSFPETRTPIKLAWYSSGRFGVNRGETTTVRDWYDAQIGVTPKFLIENTLNEMMESCDNTQPVHARVIQH
jgi:hypothetical protein